MKSRWMMLPLTLVTGLATLGAGLLWQVQGAVLPAAWSSRPAQAPTITEVEAPGVPRSIAILSVWDGRRAAAYATGSVRDLRRLYLPSSRAGARDAAMLEAYRARGLRVTGMRTQVLAHDVRERSAHRLVLVLTDRILGAAARRAKGGCCAVVLPRDGPSTRTVTLVRHAGGWVVAESTSGAARRR